jgi:hypothetical protein
MRTLQEKYNAIQEGNFSKDQFLVEARMQQPQLITRFNGYDDAVQILKNRGMIQEAANFKFSDLKQGSIIQNKFSGKKYTVTAVRDKSADIQKGDDGRETEIASLNNYELVKEARLTNKSLTDYRYKPTNEMDKYPYEQILRGLRVELEVMGVQGTPTAEEYAKALAKVSKNLAKDSIFYTNQLAGVNPKVDLHDKMVDVTAKNTVDTFNGMKKVKDLKEGKTPDIQELVLALLKKHPNMTWTQAVKKVKEDLKEAHIVRPDGSIKTSTDKTNNKPGYTVKPGGSIKKEDHTKNPNDKYVVKFSKANNTYQVWEGDHLVTDFATEEKAKAYADRENKKQDLTEKVLKEGIKNLIKKVLKEEDLERAERGVGNPYGTEEEYELFNSPEEGKSDAEYKNELKQYLQDNQIYGYTDYIHDLMTGPDPDEAYKDLAEFLEDEGIYGYNRGIERIYADYPYDQHWMNQEDEDKSLEEIGMFHDPVGYRESEPKPQMYTKKFVRATDKRGIYVYDIFKNGKLVKTIEGGEGDANAWMNNASREEDLFESISLKDLL